MAHYLCLTVFNLLSISMMPLKQLYKSYHLNQINITDDNPVNRETRAKWFTQDNPKLNIEPAADFKRVASSKTFRQHERSLIDFDWQEGMNLIK